MTLLRNYLKRDCHPETVSKPSAHPNQTDEHYLRDDALTVQCDRRFLGALVPFPETCPEARDTLLGEGGSHNPGRPLSRLPAFHAQLASGTVKHRFR